MPSSEVSKADTAGSATPRAARRVFNFSPGPAMFPDEIMTRVQEEFLNFAGLGASVIEISHRAKEFVGIAEEAAALFRELVSLPQDYSILFMHGGGRMQFSAVPMNLIARTSARKAAYVETGVFSATAIKDACAYGKIETVASSQNDNFARVPDLSRVSLAPDTAYLHITTNNTAYGTRWNKFPETGGVPLVGDATSEILSRVMDYSRFGVVYAGVQKNLGPAGTAIVVVRKDLMQYALPETPPLLNYAVVDKGKSLVNTPSTFNIYFTLHVMRWIKDLGGVGEIERRNNEKARLLYDFLDRSSYYRPIADHAHRSTMNVTFGLPSPEATESFVAEANQAGLYALKGYRQVGGIRASIYNGMPLAGVRALVSFMQEFERAHG
jgi:phosphoserine aminotransferase